MLCRRLVPASVSIDNQTERVDAEMVSGNYFTMLGVKPALGRVFNSQEDDQVYQGHPGRRARATTTGTSRFARDPGVVGKKILVNNYPMTIVGVSAAGLCRPRSGAVAADPRADPDEAGDGARVGLGAHGRPRARAGCRCSRG